MNIKPLITVGAILCFISLIYSGAQYFDMRYMENVVKAQAYGNDDDVDKLKQISTNKPSDLQLFLSEIRSKDKQLSLLTDGMNKMVSHSKFVTEVEIVLWLITTCLFSVLLIWIERKKRE